MKSEATVETPRVGVEPIQASLQRLERRDWWLWWTAVVVMLLLAAAVVASSLPAFLRKDVSWLEFFLDFNITQAVRGLVGLVLLFNLYAIYQHAQIRHLRRQLAGLLEARAAEHYKLAVLDSLTGLANRRSGQERLVTDVARSLRHGLPLTVLLVDLNNFKQINERHGQPAGDLVLKQFAERLKKASRGSDLAVRLEDDEFMLLLPECLPGQVPQLLARLTGVEVKFDGTKLPITFSAGWAEYQHGETPEDLLKRADQELYADKRTGRVEEQIQQAQKMQTLGQLAGGLAHELTNVVMIVKSHAELALDKAGPGDSLRVNLEDLRKAADRAIALTRQFLAFSRKQTLRPEILNLNALVVDIERMLRQLIGAHIEIQTKLEPGLGQVKADRTQLDQILLNLAANARDAMPEGGTLTIETANVQLDEAYARTHPGARPGPCVMLAVGDTGCGMDKETLVRIFEPFFTTKEKNKGTGLGLAIVYGIVKQAAGYIWVDSEPARGSTFTVYLPRVQDDVPAAQPA